MHPTFGDMIRNLATTVEVVDDWFENHVRTLIERYMRESLQMDFYHVMIDDINIGGEPALHTAKTSGLWSNEKPDSVPVRRRKNRDYLAQSTYAYGNRTPLWVTAKGEPLHVATSYDDQWSLQENLPEYSNERKQDIRTSIAIPLEYGARVFGFMTLETKELIDCNTHAKTELQSVANAIATILHLHDAYQHQKNGMEKTFEELGALITTTSPLEVPKVFLACSDEAPRDVVGVLRDRLNQRSGRLKIVYWKDVNESGNINAQMLSNITECQFGVCYFSQPEGVSASSGEAKYIDNLNVIFEAGILHALTNSPLEPPEAWIPVREKHSPKTPFDFAQERIVWVPRFKDGRLNEEDFVTRIDNRLNGLLG